MTLVISDRDDFKEKLEFLIAATDFIFASGATDDEDLTDQLLDSFINQFDPANMSEEVPKEGLRVVVLPSEDDDTPGYYDGSPHVFMGFTIVNTATGNVPPHFVDKVYKTTEKASAALVTWVNEHNIELGTRFAVKKVYVDTEHY